MQKLKNFFKQQLSTTDARKVFAVFLALICICWGFALYKYKIDTYCIAFIGAVLFIISLLCSKSFSKCIHLLGVGCFLFTLSSLFKDAIKGYSFDFILTSTWGTILYHIGAIALMFLLLKCIKNIIVK